MSHSEQSAKARRASLIQEISSDTPKNLVINLLVFGDR